MSTIPIIVPTSDGGQVKLSVDVSLSLTATGSGTAEYTPPPPPPPAPPLVPDTAIWSPALESQSGWQNVHDTGTSGTSSGTGPTLPSPCGALFSMNWTSGGGQRWWKAIADDLTVSHFCYDTWVWIDNPAVVNCLELDVNHVIANGDTVIHGIQWVPQRKCWMWTTMPGGKATWNDSNIAAAVSDFSAKTWHHVQLVSHHDAVGVVTYDSVTIDGVTKPFVNASGASHAALGWGPLGHININMQVDGLGASGSVQVFHSNLRIARW